MNRRRERTAQGLLVVSLLACTACESYPWLPFRETGGGTGTVTAGDSTSSDVPVTVTGDAFVDNLIQDRTFTAGTGVTTITHANSDIGRTPLGIDFNGDGKVDPVVSYGRDQAVMQILLSQGGAGSVDYVSLTLDSKRDMENLADVAVGDIDGDGFLDLVGAAEAAVWYMHHPSTLPTTELRAWGNPDPIDPLRERIDASVSDPNDPNQDIQSVITAAIGPGVNIDDYIITVEELYTNVEIGDFDLNGSADIAAARRFKITMTPRPERPVVPIEIVDGDILVFTNPGGATTGHGWQKISAGRHERQQRLDRDGAAGLLAYDLDGDGDLDLISAARDDNNAQVAWFENPGPPLDPSRPWTQWRLGSVRDATGITIADLTGDGRPDVVATGGAQKQMLLFEQPADGPERTFDWDTYAIVEFENFEPRDVRALDIDNDGVLELVASGTNGAVRYFERPANPRDPWKAEVLVTFADGGEVGLLGFGDLDGDGDFDLVAVVDGREEENNSRILWIRNDLAFR